MIDYTELKRLAEKVTSLEKDAPDWDDAWNHYDAASVPEVVLALIAENDANRHEREVVCVNYDQLKAENESLRLDAERYRFLRRGDDRNEVTCMVVMLNRRTGMHVYVQDAYADTQTDAAMAKGEKSCATSRPCQSLVTRTAMRTWRSSCGRWPITSRLAAMGRYAR